MVLAEIRIITLAVKWIGALWLLSIYVKTKRRSSLIMALAMIFYGLHTLGDLLALPTFSAIAESLFSTLVGYGVSYFLIEEGKYPRTPVIFSLIPLLSGLYLVALSLSSPGNVLGGVYGISGLFIAISGYLLWKTRASKKISALALSLLFIGLHQMDYPFLRPIEWFAPIGFAIATILTMTLVIGIVKFFGSEEYFKKGAIKVEIKSGALLISPSEFKERYLPTLQDMPVLAFVRNIEAPKSWYSYLISNIEDQKSSIFPTNLPRILEISRRYFSSVKNGIVVIDALEYLTIYNGFEAIAKFLATLRDFAILDNGTVIIITEKKAWKDREWALLTSLLGK
ncbi:MAG: hypothetical protein PWP39_1205 [Pyrococcus sp.]|uniref:DUF835 domain-containing protein n=1 Tax=Pyrococcus sp. TaxID=33866 RepID=UPI00258AC288|nr:DUF835 domain-containing protein [Pyrococcus sp.]MDK2869970.1 hypothetical protein [Pyrococcus sp.]